MVYQTLEKDEMTKLTSPITWKKEYETGVPEIDEQHMILVHTLNDASQKLAEESSLQTLEKITQDLLSYALYHFETEEDLMQKYGYQQDDEVNALRHLTQHRSFSEKVVSVRENLKSAAPISPDDLLDFLNNWLINHILNTDKKLGDFILEKRSGG